MTAFNQLSWMVHTERDLGYNTALSQWPQKSHSGHLSNEKQAHQWEPKTPTRSDLAVNRGMLLSRSGVPMGETENDVTLGKKRGK